jgi:hypothetical protein
MQNNRESKFFSLRRAVDTGAEQAAVNVTFIVSNSSPHVVTLGQSNGLTFCQTY